VFSLFDCCVLCHGTASQPHMLFLLFPTRLFSPRSVITGKEDDDDQGDKLVKSTNDRRTTIVVCPSSVPKATAAKPHQSPRIADSSDAEGDDGDLLG
jgi:hypothetical protein